MTNLRTIIDPCIRCLHISFMSTTCLSKEALVRAAAVAALFACETREQSSGPTGDLEPHPLCAECRAVAENTDISSSDLSCCTASRSALEAGDAKAAAFDVDRYVSWIEAGFDGPFTWRRSWGASSTSGYSTQTELALAASVEGVEYVAQEPYVDGRNALLCQSVSCEDYLDFRIRLDLAAADGSIAGQAEIHGRSQSFPEAVVAAGELPIANFSGSLDIGSVDEVQQQEGGIIAVITFSDHGAQGRISPWIGALAEDPQGVGVGGGPLEGRWPLANCVERGFPISIDEPFAAAESRSPSELFEEFARGFGSSRSPATWYDGTTTEVLAEIAGDFRQVCGGGENPHLYYSVPLHLQTGDSRLDVVVDAELSLRWDAIDGLLWTWRMETDVVDGLSMREIVGDGIEVNPATPEAQLTAVYESGGGFVSLAAVGQPQVEYLRW
jgi:hypothetical protein